MENEPCYAATFAVQSTPSVHSFVCFCFLHAFHLKSLHLSLSDLYLSEVECLPDGETFSVHSLVCF